MKLVVLSFGRCRDGWKRNKQLYQKKISHRTILPLTHHTLGNQMLREWMNRMFSTRNDYFFSGDHLLSTLDGKSTKFLFDFCPNSVYVFYPRSQRNDSPRLKATALQWFEEGVGYWLECVLRKQIAIEFETKKKAFVRFTHSYFDDLQLGWRSSAVSILSLSLLAKRMSEWLAIAKLTIRSRCLTSECFFVVLRLA